MPEDGRLLIGGSLSFPLANDSLIRANNGFLYLFGNTSNLEVRKANQAGVPAGDPPPPYVPQVENFSQVIPNFPVSGMRLGTGTPVVMDSSGLCHVLYRTFNNGFSFVAARIYHNTFDPSTDTWGTPEVVTDNLTELGDTRNQDQLGMFLAIDDNDDLHYIVRDRVRPFGGGDQDANWFKYTAYRNWYGNRIAGISGGAETTAIGSAALTGGLGDVLSITVDGVEIMSGPETLQSFQLFAMAIADNINAHTSVPNYIAIAGGHQAFFVMIRATTQGSGPNGFVVATTVTGSLNFVGRPFFGGGVEMWNNESFEVWSSSITNLGSPVFPTSPTDIIIAHPTTAINEDRVIILGAPPGGQGISIYHSNALNATSFVNSAGNLGVKLDIHNFVVDSERNIHFCNSEQENAYVYTHEIGDSWDTWTKTLAWTDRATTRKGWCLATALYINPANEKILFVSINVHVNPAFTPRDFDAVYSIPSVVTPVDQWARWPEGVLAHMPMPGFPSQIEHLGVRTRWSNKNMNSPNDFDVALIIQILLLVFKLGMMDLAMLI